MARILLVVVTPILAVGANVLRIVTTGLIARRFGAIAAQETLHTGLGILLFMTTVVALLALERGLQWAKNGLTPRH